MGKKRKYGNPLKEKAYRESLKGRRQENEPIASLTNWTGKDLPYEDYTVLSNTCETLIVSYATRATLIEEMKKVKSKAMQLWFEQVHGIRSKDFHSPCGDYTNENIVNQFLIAKTRGDDCITLRGVDTGIDITVGPSSIIKRIQRVAA